MTTTRKTVVVEGAGLSYQDVGEGPPVVLLHAFPLHSELFAPQVKALTSRYRLILPDLRGFGQSELGGTTVSTMQRHAQDVLAVMDDAGVPSAVVGGVSMGGYVSMALLQEDPSRVRALILVDTQMGADDEAGKAKREENARDTLKGGMGVLVERMMSKMLTPKAAPELVDRTQQMFLGNSPAGAAASLRGMALRPDSRDILGRFGHPALVVVGEEDSLTPPEKSRAMAEVLSRSSYQPLPGAAHLANLEAPEAFNRAVDEFLAGLR